MFVWQTHSLVAVIRIIGKSDNPDSDYQGSTAFVNIIHLFGRKVEVGIQNATRPRCYQNSTVSY
jgi:hypothetical protein